MPAALPDDLVRLIVLARRLGVSSSAVHNWTHLRADPLPHYRVGGLILVSESEAAAWVLRRSGRGG